MRSAQIVGSKWKAYCYSITIDINGALFEINGIAQLQARTKIGKTTVTY